VRPHADLTFYLGSHHSAWLAFADVPLFISHRRLAARRNLPRAATAWALDSGGFTELDTCGRWRVTETSYLHSIARYHHEIGRLRWCAPQDWMCEPRILARTGLTVRDHQRRTVDSVLSLRTAHPPVPVIPVLQGWTIADYLRCAELYETAGIDLRAEPIVGVGSVCRRQATREIETLVTALGPDGLGLRLHGFGVSLAGSRRYGRSLASADSLAWSYAARRQRNPLNGCRHRSCQNCYRFARAFYDRAASALRQAATASVQPALFSMPDPSVAVRATGSAVADRLAG